MLLAIDIGNSTTKFGVFDNEKLTSRFETPTQHHKTPDEIINLIKNDLPASVDAVIISSVVPESNAIYKKLCESRFDVEPVFVGSDFDLGMPINYEPRENLGIDRAVAAFAAREKFGKPVIVCDFGTATTIDAVDSSGEFIGGIIVPGISTLADSLFRQTANLPKVDIAKAERVIASSTVSAINAGIYFGYLGMVEKILTKMIEELGEHPKIIATGGFATFIAESVEMIEIIDENLILEGLNLIHQETKTTK